MSKKPDTTKNTLSKILWEDPVLYKHRRREEFPCPTKTLTTGSIVEDREDYLIVSDPITYTVDEAEDDSFIPRKFGEATFMFIPKGLILEISEIN